MKKIITYADGSGNTYIISGSEEIFLEYNPIKPFMSSSGVYDGGDYKKMKISQLDYDNIMKIINKAIANKSIHIENRVKGSGLIIIQVNDSENSYIIKSASQEQLQIEELFKKILGQ